MLIQLYDPKTTKYLVIDTIAKTNSRWYLTFDEAMLHFDDLKLNIPNTDYSLASLKRVLSHFEISEINPPTQSYEFW